MSDTDDEFMDIRVSLKHAQAVSRLLDLASRLGIGQINMIGEAVRMGDIPGFAVKDDPRYPDKPDLSFETKERVDALAEAIKQELGYPKNGSYGIGSQNVPDTAKLGWEVKKVIDQALAYHRDPNPSFKGVNYDGVDSLRYAGGPAPTAQIVEPEFSPKP